MGQQNPFTALGLTPAVIRGLSDDHVQMLVKNQYRVLSTIHHPDHGGKESQFKILTWAFEQIDQEKNPQLFSFWRERFLKKINRRTEVSHEAKALETKCFEISRHFLAFLGALAEKDPPKGSYSAFNLRSARLLMQDTAFLSTLQKARNSVGSKWMSDEMATAFDLEIATDGSLTRFDLAKTKIETREELPVDIPKPWYYLSTSPHHSYYWRRTGEGTALEDIRLIGALPMMKLSELRDKALREFRPLLDGLSNEEAFSRITEGYPAETFFPYLPFVQPHFQECNASHCLIGGKVVEGQFFVVVVGQVRHVHQL